jgi:hypothetical protein
MHGSILILMTDLTGRTMASRRARRTERQCVSRALRVCVCVALGCVLIVSGSTRIRAAMPQATGGPRIQFATNTIDLGLVHGGSVVNRSFVFTNVGDQALLLTQVRSSCGCVTLGWYSKAVEPGQTGEIPIRFADGGLSGTFTKTVLGTCNDPAQPDWSLRITGTVRQPIHLSSRVAILEVSDELPLATNSLFLTNQQPEPLRLGVVQSDNPALGGNLRTLEEGRVFELAVRTLRPMGDGAGSAMITVQTSSSNMPTVAVTAMVMQRPVVAVEPDRIVLPAPPMTNEMVARLTVRNHGTNQLSVSTPSVNLPGVQAESKESLSGRQFEITLRIPAGCKIPPGESAAFTLRTSHPRFPSLTVPVLQRQNRLAPGRQPSVVPGSR